MTIQQFCKKINLLIINVNELKSENAIFNQFTNEVMSDLNIFSSRVLKRIFRYINGTSIVIIYGEMFLTNIIINKEFLHPKELSATTTNSNVPSFSSGERYGILLLTHPWNKIVSQIDTPIRSTLMIISIANPINIRIPNQYIIYVLIIPNTKVTSGFNVFDDTLNHDNIRLFWVGLISSTYSTTVANIKSTSSKVKKIIDHASIESRINTIA